MIRRKYNIIQWITIPIFIVMLIISANVTTWFGASVTVQRILFVPALIALIIAIFCGVKKINLCTKCGEAYGKVIDEEAVGSEMEAKTNLFGTKVTVEETSRDYELTYKCPKCGHQWTKKETRKAK